MQGRRVSDRERIGRFLRVLIESPRFLIDFPREFRNVLKRFGSPRRTFRWLCQRPSPPFERIGDSSDIRRTCPQPEPPDRLNCRSAGSSTGIQIVSVACSRSCAAGYRFSAGTPRYRTPITVQTSPGDSAGILCRVWVRNIRSSVLAVSRLESTLARCRDFRRETPRAHEPDDDEECEMGAEIAVFAEQLLFRMADERARVEPRSVRTGIEYGVYVLDNRVFPARFARRLPEGSFSAIFIVRISPSSVNNSVEVFRFPAPTLDRLSVFPQLFRCETEPLHPPACEHVSSPIGRTLTGDRDPIIRNDASPFLIVTSPGIKARCASGRFSARRQTPSFARMMYAGFSMRTITPAIGLAARGDLVEVVKRQISRSVRIHSFRCGKTPLVPGCPIVSRFTA